MHRKDLRTRKEQKEARYHFGSLKGVLSQFEKNQSGRRAASSNALEAAECMSGFCSMWSGEKAGGGGEGPTSQAGC